MAILRRLKKALPIFLLILQILFSLSPLSFLVSSAQAQDSTIQITQTDSQLNVDNYSGDFAVYYVVDGEIVAHQGEADGDLELFLASVSDNDVINHQPDRLVLKIDGEVFYLLMGEVERSYDSSDLELADGDQDFLYNDWQINGQEAVTTWRVREGVTYKFPLNEQVQLRFNELPSEASALTIEEVVLSADLKLALGSVSEIAYDVRTEMENGEFSYDLYLPKNSEDREVEIKYAQDLAELEKEAKLVEEGVSLSDEQVKLVGLDHMTVFVVVNSGLVTDCDDVYNPNTGCYSSIQAAIDDASDGHTIYVGSGTYIENVIINVPNLTLQSKEGRDETTIENPNLGSEDPGIKILDNLGIVVIDGFTVEGFRNGITQGMASAAGTASHIMNNKIIPENNDTNPYLRNGIQVTGEGSKVTGNYVVGAPLTSTWASSGIGVVNAKNVLVEGNTVNTGGADIGISIYNYSNVLVEDITITNNTVIGAGKAIRVDGKSGSINQLSNIYILSNTLRDCSRAGIQLYNAVLDNISIENNDILHNYLGVESSSVSISDLSILNNNITDNDYGIYNFSSTTLNTSNSVNHNNFEDNKYYAIGNNSIVSLNATSNFWGDNSGPYHITTNTSASGDRVSDNVLYSPWTSILTEEEGEGSGIVIGESGVGDFVFEDLTIKSPQTGSGTGSISIFKYDAEPKTGALSFGVNGYYYNIEHTGDLKFPITLELRYNDSDFNENKFVSLYYFDGTNWIDYQKDDPASTISIDKDNNVIIAEIQHLTPIAVGVDTTSPMMADYGLSDLLLNSAENSLELTGNINDALSPISSVKYAIWDSTKSTVYANWTETSALDGAYDSLIESTSEVIDLSLYPEGDYVLGVRGWDEAGNKASGGDFYFTIDKTNPTITVKAAPDSIGDFTNKLFSKVSFKLYDQYKIDKITLNGVEKDLSNNKWTDLNNVGVHNWFGEVEGANTLVAYDVAGNSTSYDFVLDRIVPQGSIDSIYYSGSNKSKDYFVTNDNKPVFEGTCSDNNGLQEVTLEVGRQVQTINCETDNTWRSAPLSSALTDGDYLVTLTLTDLAGNVTNKTQELKIDTVTPNAVHTYYKNGETILGDAEVYAQSTGQLTFTGEYTDADPSSGLYWDSFVIFEAQDDGSFRFSANGKKSYCLWRKQPNLVNLSGSNFSLTDQISFANCETDLEDGVYYLAHQIYDLATRKDIPSINQFRDVLGLRFTIDTTVPTSTITNPDGDTYHSGPITIEGNTTDLNGVVSVKLSSAPYENEACGEYSEITTLNIDPALTSYDWTYDWTPDTEGQYCIKAQGTDVASNVEQTAVVKNVIYDKTIPEVDLSVNPADPDGSGSWYITRPEVTLTASDNFEVDHIQYRWGTTGSWSTYSTPLQSPSEGTNTLYYRAVDKAGNISEEGIKTLQWDQTELTEGPLNIKADPNPTAESTSTISWDHADDNIGISKYKVTWDLRDGDDKHSKEVAGDVTETKIDELKEGSYKITVTAYDGSGYNKSATTNLIVDRTAPIAPVLTLLAQRPGEIDLAWEVIADADRYIIYYGLEAGNYLYAADVGNVTDYTVTGLTAGNYYFIVRAVDASDNQSANSNEVSILDLVGAPAGTLIAEGFTEAGEVQGETTEASEEEQAVMNEEIAKQGEVKGAAITCTALSKSLFWLFLAMQAAAILLLAKFSKQGWLKLLAFLALPAVFTAIIMRTDLANCFGNETMVWLTNNYYLPAYLTAMLTKMAELFFIVE
jgi:hypothetical protein